MTLDDLSTYEQHEYDIYADSLIYVREYQVECQYCHVKDSGAWEQLEHVKGWLLAKRETCPTCANKAKAEDAMTDELTYNRRGVCDHCHRTDMWVTDYDSESLCERCVQDYDEAQLFIAAIGGM